MNTKGTIIVGMIMLCLGAVSTGRGADPWGYGAHIWYYENGVPTTEPTVVEEFEVVQDAFPMGAIALDFKVWQKEDNIDIIGWDILVTGFVVGSASRGQQPEPAHSTAAPSGENPDNGRHAIDVTATFYPVTPHDPSGGNPGGIPNPFDDPHILYGQVVRVTIRLWLTSYNTIRIANAHWRSYMPIGLVAPANIPDHGWSIGFPIALAAQPGQYAHKMSFFNDGNDPIFFSDMRYMALPDKYADFNDLSFKAAAPVPDMELAGGKAAKGMDVPAADISTKGDFVGNFIYHTYKVGKFPGDPNAVVVKARHLVVPPPPHIPPVPTLSQWGLIAMALLVAAAGAVTIVRRRRLSVR
jgi:hypothetical protein